MAQPSNKLLTIDVGISEDLNRRVKLRCAQMSLDRAVFIRLATLEHLDRLDEREAYLNAQKAIAKGGATGVASLPTTTARGMDIEIPKPATITPTAPGGKLRIDYLEKSFRKYCDYIDGNDGAIDRSIRLQTCLDDLRQRAKTPEEAHAAFIALQELLARRADAGIGVSPLKLPDDVALEGDVDG